MGIQFTKMLNVREKYEIFFCIAFVKTKILNLSHTDRTFRIIYFH